MSEPTVVEHPLLDVRLWVAALFGGFVLGALPYSLLALIWSPVAELAFLTWPVAAAGILYVACRSDSERPV